MDHAAPPAIIPWWRPLSLVATVLAASGAFFSLHATSSDASEPPAPADERTAGPSEPLEAKASSDPGEPSLELARIGRAVFFDPSLSEPPGMSCARCHDPAHGYAGNNGAKLGVAQGSRPGHFSKRNTPSVLYLGFVRRFHFHWEEDAPLPDAFGGFFWDGRVDSLADLAKQPLLNPDEMGNRDVSQLGEKIAAGAYAADLSRAFGATNTPEAAVAALGKAIAAFLLSPEMSPFSSKYDDYVRGKASFTPLEARGLALFKDNAKGACASCHKLNDTSPNPERSPFSDYGFETVGVPRNRDIPATRDPKYVDRGLCEHADPLGQTTDERWCGSFRTPSLRNVATRSAFMHNGAFTSLRDVVAFYATRSTSPKRWYRAEKYDDLPPKYRQYVNDQVAPYNRLEGDAPPLDEAEIDAVVEFLKTLSDAPHAREATQPTHD
jgi:cytochrome c peroxidase